MLGYFAGGLAQGLQQGQKMGLAKKREEREDQAFAWEKEQKDREAGVRQAGSNTFGNVGTQREDGSTYTEDDAYGDYTKQTAGLDPRESRRARAEGLQVRATRREDQFGEAESAFFDFARAHANAPDEVLFPAGAKFATAHVQDGKAFGVTFDPNEGWKATKVNPDGSAATFGIPDRNTFLRMLQKYTSPRMMQAADTAEHQDKVLAETRRRTDVMDRHYARADADRRTHLGLIRDRMPPTRNRNTEIIFAGLERELAGLQAAIPRADTPEQMAMINRELRAVRGRMYDAHVQAKELDPKTTPKWQFLQIPHPIDTVQRVMADPKARDEVWIRTKLSEFDQLYGGDPSTAEARNALDVFIQKKFSVVEPETLPPNPATGMRMGPALEPWRPQLQGAWDRMTTNPAPNQIGPSRYGLRSY